MENKLPLASVIMANHNYSQWIADAIRSVLLQDYPNKNLVICDDCSTDNSVDAVKSFCSQLDSYKEEVIEDNNEYKSYRFLSKPCDVFLIAIKKNGGPSRARNYGIKLASKYGASIYAVIDSDDIWKQGKLSKSVVKILEDPEVIGGVYTDYQHYNVETDTLTYESKEPFSQIRLMQDCIVHSGCVINGLALQKCGVYDEDLRVCEDYNLWLRISKFFVFAHIPEDLVIVRVQPNNSTNTVDAERWKRDYYFAKQRALQQ